MSDPVAHRFRDRLGSRSHRGQSLAELAVVLPLLLVLTGGIVQVGSVIATKHTLIQIGRDVGRWAATQPADPCEDLADEDQPAVRAHEIAVESRLMGYTGQWDPVANPSSFTRHGTSSGVAAMLAQEPTTPGVEVEWTIVSGDCPPEDSTTVAFVTVRLAHEAPVLVPGFNLVLAALPDLGSDGVLLITTTAQFRMEPQAQPPSEGG